MLQISPRFPFDPSRVPFFYGWLVLVLGTLGVVASMPGQTTGLSVFTDPLIQSTGLSRSQLSNAYLLGTLASGLLLPYGGVLLDRVGARLMGALSASALAGSLLLLSWSDVLASFAARTLPVDLTVRFLVLVLLFAFLRFSGQGMLTLTSRTMMARWFDRRRGTVTAASGALISVSFSMAPMVFFWWIGAAGWRGAWREMAFVLLGFGALALLLFRDTPEECRLLPDGTASTHDDEAASSTDQIAQPPRERAFTRAEALVHPLFWILTLGVSNQSLVGTGLTFHLVDLAGEAQMAPERFVRLLLPISAVSIITGFVSGALVDRIRVIHLIRAMLAFQVFMFASAAFISEPPARVALVIFWGLSGGFYGPLTVAALPRLFGRLNLGAISGAMTMVLVIASALGPSFLSIFREATGTYAIGLAASCLLPLAGLLASVVFTRTERS